MDLVRSSSSRSITGKLNDMRIYLGVSYLTQKNVVMHTSAESLNCSRPQASPKTAPIGEKRVSVYISDEDMHLCTSTEEDDSDAEAPVIRSIPSSASATFFRKIRIQEMLRNAQVDENMFPPARQVLNPSEPPKRQINLLQPSNHCIPPPIVIIDRCEASDLTRHKTKRVRLSRRGLTAPTYR
jgi:methenyltetrahydromethanopterin cyclohydrolase